ncbi:uncharacterized protein LOC118348894 [Juglans regia]|uniref:Uncharacterized protein LOC118348894 n=1 Tax=Juglans regia TaxID=51240 RepID=A0A6P9EIM0_JUGRE|nr:uncharacterized protein LOC118348894 [Juglans regia]
MPIDDSSSSSAVPRHSHEDDLNPYFLHSGDHSGAILVSQPLNGDNDLTWNRSILFVLSWLLNALSKEIASSIIYIDSVEDMWNDFKERFSQSNQPRTFRIRKAIVSLIQETSSVSSYFTRLKSFWEEMFHFRSMPPCSCGVVKKIVEYQQEDYVLQFLMGLNESYAHLWSRILLSDLFSLVNKVFSLIFQEEKQCEIVSDSLPSNEVVVMFNNRDSSSHDSMKGSIGPKNNKQSVTRKERPYCTHYDLLGHTVDKCYKIHGYPPRYKAKPRNSTTN